MLLFDVFDEYLEECKKTHSPETVKRYMLHLDRFARGANPHVELHLEEINDRHISDFYRFMTAHFEPYVNSGIERISSYTVRSHVNTVHAFFNWADKKYQCGRIDRRLPDPKLKVDLEWDEAYSNVVIWNLQDACKARYKQAPSDVGSSNAMELLSRRLVFALLVEHGLTTREISRLRFSNVKIEYSSVVLVFPKSRRQTTPLRAFRVNDDTSRLFKKFLRRVHLEDDDRLFPYSPAEIRQEIKQIARMAGYDNIEMRRLRITFAVNHIENGGTKESLRMHLGDCHETFIQEIYRTVRSRQISNH